MGALKRAWFMALRNSIRALILTRSAIEKFLITDKSQLLMPSLRRLPKRSGQVRRWFCGLSAESLRNAASVLNHWSGLRPFIVIVAGSPRNVVSSHVRGAPDW